MASMETFAIEAFVFGFKIVSLHSYNTSIDGDKYESCFVAVQPEMKLLLVARAENAAKASEVYDTMLYGQLAFDGSQALPPYVTVLEERRSKVAFTLKGKVLEQLKEMHGWVFEDWTGSSIIPDVWDHSPHTRGYRQQGLWEAFLTQVPVWVKNILQ